MAHQPPRILIFDSGVGGLSILEQIRKQHPHCAFMYASDNAAFPYGPKSESALVDRVDRVLRQLQLLTQADIIVIACNTASTLALPRIRSHFTQPVIGVVPAIKPAAKVSKTKVIGLLATPGTVKRDYTQQLIDDFAPDCRVIAIGSSELVALAEQKLRQEAVDINTITPIVAPFVNEHALDTVVLACTHFPLLTQELQQVLHRVPHWVDSGEAIARRVGYWLEALALLPSTCTQPICKSYFTARTQAASDLHNTLAHWGLGDVTYIDMPYSPS